MPGPTGTETTGAIVLEIENFKKTTFKVTNETLSRTTTPHAGLPSVPTLTHLRKLTMTL